MKTGLTLAALVSVFAAALAGYLLAPARDQGVLAVCADVSYGTSGGTSYVDGVTLTSPVETNGAVACQVGQLVDVRPQKQQPGP